VAGDARCSVTIIKSFDYRGSPEEWSNTYHFTGDAPSDDAAWKGLADDVIADEKAIYQSSCEVVRAVGHVAGSVVAAWSYDYAAASESVPGTFAGSGAAYDAGDAAVWVRWSTDALTSRGKPIYLRSYFHNAAAAGTTPTYRDTVHADQQAALQALGDAWIAGYTVDSEARYRCGPNGAVGLVALPSTYLTTRTLERRGRRPTSP
jgi:hypothetical protein